MSTDTMYFNSSRLLASSSKNKNNSVTRLDKKRMQTERKNRVRQETIDVKLPEPQVLPNGEKPDFGNSKSSRKARQESGSSKKSNNYSSPKDDGLTTNNDFDAAKVTQDLRGMYLKSKDDKSKGNNNRKKKDKTPQNKNSAGNTMESADGSSRKNERKTPHSTPLMTSDSQPLQTTPPSGPSMMSTNNYSVSPLFMNSGLNVGLPPTRPPSSPAVPTQFQQQQQAPYVGYPYGNYSLVSPFNTPQFMAPQTPLMNPLYPQPPLHQLPVMCQALDIQQRQMEQQYHQHTQNGSYPPMPSQHHYPRPVSAPLGIVEVPKITEPTSVIARSKPYEKHKQSSTSFAGASFASKDPKINNLPKPSFA